MEMLRVALVRIPKLEILVIMSIAELNIANNPIPTGPIHRATNLVRITEHKILNTCMLPNTPIAFTMVRDILESPVFAI